MKGQAPSDQMRAVVWHDANGRIVATNSGPYDDEAIAKIKSGPGPSGATALEIRPSEFKEHPSVQLHYVKNGKIERRPDLIPDETVLNVSSLDNMPDLPKGAEVIVNELDHQILTGPGKPEIPDEGNVVMRVEAFPAKPVVVNIHRANAQQSVAPRMVHPKRR